MRKINRIITMLLLAVFLINCEEDFSPYSDLKEEFHIYCVLQDNSSTQTLKIFRSYLGDNIDPNSYTEEPFVGDSRIWIRNNKNDDVVLFEEGNYLREDSTKYGKNIHYYYATDFIPQNNTEYAIEVLLPDGNRMYSDIETTPPVQFMWMNCQHVFPPSDVTQTSIGYVWNQDIYEAGFEYICRLKIRYSYLDGPIEEYYIPLGYPEDGSDEEPTFREMSTENFVAYRVSIVEEALRRLSEDEPLKEKFTIYDMECEVGILNRTIENYYQSTFLRSNNISITLNETYYSNFEGGKGIFGAVSYNTIKTSFNSDYIRRLGYNYNSNGGNNE